MPRLPTLTTEIRLVSTANAGSTTLAVAPIATAIPAQTTINLTSGVAAITTTLANAGATSLQISPLGVTSTAGNVGICVGFPTAINATKQIINRVKRRTFGDGYVQSAPDGINPTKVIWNISFPGLNLGYGNYLEALLNSSVSTSSTTIQWQAPDEFVETDWLLDGNIQREFISTSLGISNISCSLVRYFSL